MNEIGLRQKQKALSPASEALAPEWYGVAYQSKRLRNNVAVCKTRQKKRQEEQEADEKINQLKEENEILERRVEAMKSELKLLKEMIIAIAPSSEIK